MGKGLSALYMEFYKFPFTDYHLHTDVVILAALVSIIAGMSGTLVAVYRAVQLPPAEAMRPETPTVYRETLIERLGLQRLFSQPTRMIARHIERRPVKTLLTVRTGVSSKRSCTACLPAGTATLVRPRPGVGVTAVACPSTLARQPGK